VIFIAGDPLTITSRTPGQDTLLLDIQDHLDSDANGLLNPDPSGFGTPWKLSTDKNVCVPNFFILSG